MAAALRVAELELTYPRARAPCLRGVSFDLAAGERLLVTGPSGSGKSSLALCWNGIVPQSIPARLSGQVELCGRAVAETLVAEHARSIAYVFQDADTQLCALSVEDEIAFALENRGLPAREIDLRIDAAMAALGLPRELRCRETVTLSGGEKQKVVLAAALAQDVPLYVFDEPTSQLDPEATANAYAVIERLAGGAERPSLVVIDHKVEKLLARIDRVLLLAGDGTPAALDTPRAMFHDSAALVEATGAWMPAAADLFAHLRGIGLALATRPLTFAEALADLDALIAQAPECRARVHRGVAAWLRRDAAPETPPLGPPLLRLDRVSYAPRGADPIVSDVSLELHGGEIVGLVGRNGAGKSTLGQIAAGLLRPSAGTRTLVADARGGLGQFLFQNPEHQFVSETVQDELAASGVGPNAAQAALRDFGLWDKRDAHPFQLSQGQKRRLSFLAAVLAPARPVLVLDEPSYGLDAQAARAMRASIRALRRPDRAIVVISHDIDWLAGLCDRVAVLDRGRLVRLDRAPAVFGDAAALSRLGLAAPQSGAVAAWLDARA